jgi:hypothetical protein
VQATEAIGPPRLLRRRGERPSCCCAAQKGDDIAPPQMIEPHVPPKPVGPQVPMKLYPQPIRQSGVEYLSVEIPRLRRVRLA